MSTRMSNLTERQQALLSLKNVLKQHREVEAKCKTLDTNYKELKSEYDHTENALQGLQCVGQYIGDVLKQLSPEKCLY